MIHKDLTLNEIKAEKWLKENHIMVTRNNISKLAQLLHQHEIEMMAKITTHK